ncbi:MAG: hypothetical protein J7L95_05280 [Prolixibacteraceae bacterium]|nr:hypothetical protein [Prolixibacteraceae bacterium]
MLSAGLVAVLLLVTQEIRLFPDFGEQEATSAFVVYFETPVCFQSDFEEEQESCSFVQKFVAPGRFQFAINCTEENTNGITKPQILRQKEASLLSETNLPPPSVHI